MITKRHIILILALLAISYSCGQKSTESSEEGRIQLLLSADKTEGEAPLEVHFTGTLIGDIDTLLLHIPPMVFYRGTDETIIRYSLPGKYIQAERTYTSEYTYIGRGVFKTLMVLQGIHCDIVSDTLIISVE